MNKVLVIGPTYSTQVISFKDEFANNSAFNAEINNYRAGGSYLIGYDLAVLDVDTTLITRLGFDSIANNMMVSFDKLSGQIYSNHRNAMDTPQITYLIDGKTNVSTFNNFHYDMHPAIEDGFPAVFFNNNDYGIIDIINSNYLSMILRYYPNIKWVCNNNIPSEELLRHIDGIVLDYKYANTIAKDYNFYSFAQQLITHGVNWVIIVTSGKEVHLYLKDKEDIFQKEESGEFFLGCFEAFLAMLVACLSNGMQFDQAINYALNLANDFSYQNTLSLEKNFFEE